jgi:hypothetical protein
MALKKFPPFWIGLSLLGYLILQSANPAWEYARSKTIWWLVRRPHIAWLPSSVDAPFAEAGVWRQLIVYATAWLSLCSVWVGLTRRKSIRILSVIIGCNALLLSGLLAIQRATGDHRIPWPLTAWTDREITASFIYENHAAGYIGLSVFCAFALAIWCSDSGSRSLAKSTPSGLFALGGLFLIGAVCFTLSRGGVSAMALSLISLGIWYAIWRRSRGEVPATSPMIKVVVALLLVGFLIGVVHEIDFSQIYGRWNSLLTEKVNEPSVRFRIQAHAATTRMLAEHWLQGVGAGGFRYLFPAYAKEFPEIYQGGTLFWEHAHCDWLELPIELGLMGDLLLLTAAGWWTLWFIRHSIYRSPFGMPLLFGCLPALIQAGFDFPFQCPAILITWCILVAAAGRYVQLERER